MLPGINGRRLPLQFGRDSPRDRATSSCALAARHPRSRGLADQGGMATRSGNEAIHTIAMVHDYATCFEMMRRRRVRPMWAWCSARPRAWIIDYIAIGMFHEGWVRSVESIVKPA